MLAMIDQTVIGPHQRAGGNPRSGIRFEPDRLLANCRTITYNEHMDITHEIEAAEELYYRLETELEIVTPDLVEAMENLSRLYAEQAAQ